MKKTFKEITKDLGVDITAFDIPYERIEQNLRLDLNNCKSKSTILEHITKGKKKPSKEVEKISSIFSTSELQEKLSIILPALEKNSDSRLKYLLKWNGPFCKIVVEKKHKHLLKKAKGVYCFYNKKTLEPLYFGKAGKSYKRFMDYFSITPGNCMYNGQGTSVRINNLINKFLNDGNSIGLAIIPMINSSKTDIENREERLIYKFRDNDPFWNINKS
jgi:hypothetical protein